MTAHHTIHPFTPTCILFQQRGVPKVTRESILARVCLFVCWRNIHSRALVFLAHQPSTIRGEKMPSQQLMARGRQVAGAGSIAAFPTQQLFILGTSVIQFGSCI